MKQKIKQHNAFTLAEVLITLGVIGVVAAITMPTLVANIQERVRKEQVRTVKYKLTKATDKMKSLGKIGRYDAPATMNFVNELKKHMTIAKICDSSHLAECWPTDTINTYLNNSTNLSTVSVSSLNKGTGLNSLAVSSGGEDTVGIVTGDGVPMLLVYSPVCQALDEVKTYTWSVEDGKPITNATTNCISAIFDINGAKGPNRIGQDVRTLNSVFGAVNLGAPTPVSKSDCEKMKSKFGINGCEYEQDYWAGAIAACDKLGLHLPNMSTLTNLANARYGTTLIGTYTVLMHSSLGGDNCKNYINTNWAWGADLLAKSDNIICNADESLNGDGNSAYQLETGIYWSTSELSATEVERRLVDVVTTYWQVGLRKYTTTKAFCVGD